MEVFPALALPSLNTTFFESRSAPRYNPGQSASCLEANLNVKQLPPKEYLSEPIRHYYLDQEF
jgi:hypothetical protein